jgi:hypothetical protein
MDSRAIPLRTGRALHSGTELFDQLEVPPTSAAGLSIEKILPFPVRNEKVRGSNPLGSTSLRSERSVERRLHWIVPVEGLEPPRPHGHQILSLARLPIPPHRQVLGMYYARIKLAGKIVRQSLETDVFPPLNSSSSTSPGNSGSSELPSPSRPSLRPGSATSRSSITTPGSSRVPRPSQNAVPRGPDRSSGSSVCIRSTLALLFKSPPDAAYSRTDASGCLIGSNRGVFSPHRRAPLRGQRPGLASTAASD